jgi:hypothetical protein
MGLFNRDFAKASDAQVDEFIARAENALLIDRPTPTGQSGS